MQLLLPKQQEEERDQHLHRSSLFEFVASNLIFWFFFWFFFFFCLFVCLFVCLLEIGDDFFLICEPCVNERMEWERYRFGLR
jgi:hypothetical protein